MESYEAAATLLAVLSIILSIALIAARAMRVERLLEAMRGCEG